MALQMFWMICNFSSKTVKLSLTKVCNQPCTDLWGVMFCFFFAVCVCFLAEFMSILNQVKCWIGFHYLCFSYHNCALKMLDVCFCNGCLALYAPLSANNVIVHILLFVDTISLYLQHITAEIHYSVIIS